MEGPENGRDWKGRMEGAGRIESDGQWNKQEDQTMTDGMAAPTGKIRPPARC